MIELERQIVEIYGASGMSADEIIESLKRLYDTAKEAKKLQDGNGWNGL